MSASIAKVVYTFTSRTSIYDVSNIQVQQYIHAPETLCSTNCSLNFWRYRNRRFAGIREHSYVYLVYSTSCNNDVLISEGDFGF